MIQKPSIRKTLLFWLLAPILSLWLIGAIITYGLAINFAIDAWDDSLIDSARSVAGRLRFDGPKPRVDLSETELAFLKDNEKDRIYYQVLTRDGKVIAGDVRVPPPNPSMKDLPDWRDAQIEGETVRIAWMHVPVPGSPDDYMVVQIANTLTGRDQLVLGILLGVVVPQLLLILLAAGAVWIGVTKGLQPLQTVRDAVETRSQSDLSPLMADDAPQEVRPLVIAINGLLERLRKDLELQKRFVTNAAHQLRTPVAGLKTQAELALRSKPEEVHETLVRISTSADRAARLVHQLLTLARVGPVLDTICYQQVELNSIARAATEELVPKAIEKDIDLGFEGCSQGRFVSGDAPSLYELASNLIDNAVNYTQSGGKVTVRVPVDGQPRIIVEDNGPGIPEEERIRVFERFYRVLGNQASGSGLGLSIVREIADAHQAEVSLATGPNDSGTTAQVVFPELATEAGVTQAEPAAPAAVS